ncbi:MULTISPECIES: threonine synthase [Salinibaculum]|uniref:threonine synthase n=1 Tax=Salinibaculum TaxID=2732368 RepID=UPI0030D5F56B
MTTPTRCHRCGTRYREAGRRRCDCGEPVWYDIDVADFDWDDCTDADGMWRYAPILPVSEPRGLAAGAGGTPLLRSPRLDSVAGCRVFIKDEGEQPTGAYKDRGSAVAVSEWDETDAQAIGTVSYGNMAMSTAAHAASVGADCVVLVPAETSAVRLSLIEQYGPTVLRVSGDYGALYDDVLGLEDVPVEFYLSDPPARTSGYRTAVFEVYEQLRPDEPDALALPASSGGFASGVYQGVRDLRTAGLIDDLPRLYLVQTAAADPITRAFEGDDDEVGTLAPEEVGETIAHSIGNPAPPSGTVALAAARETGGAVLSVSDDEIRRAQRQFATRAGVCVEPASATTLAGVRRLSERGDVGPEERVVLLPTGTGFKEAGTGETLDPDSVEAVERTDVPSRLATLFEAE